MVDISALGNITSTEPLDLPQYKDAQEFRLPKAGRYTVQAPTEFPPTTFGKTQAGFLSAQVDPTIVGPTNEGFQIRFVRISAKTWEDKKSGVKVSQLGRYLRATGRTTPVGGDPQEQANAVEQTAGAVYQVDVDWRARNNNTGYTVEGMKNFPSDGNGGHQSWIEDPTDVDENGSPVRLRANLVVTRFLAAKA
jgi:hypothetical protein